MARRPAVNRLMERERVTLKDLAAELGLSVAAVSMALRNNRQIAAATRERVKAKAAELGYRPDPTMRALADYRTRRRAAARRWNRVALVHDWPSVEAWHGHEFYRSWQQHLQAVAAERGVEVEEHWLGAGGENARAAFRVLHNRGITGLFIAPPALTEDPAAVPIPPGRFQVVTFGPEHLYPDYHTVQFDFFENLRLAWSKLWERGHRRIGLLYEQRQGWRTGQAWRAAFHIEKLEAGWTPGEMMPLMVRGDAAETDRDAYLDWLRRDRYDAVISSVHEIEDWNRGLERAPEVAFFRVRDAGQQGVDINVEQLIRSAFEVLYLEMQQSLAGHQELPFRIHIPGRWVDSFEPAEVAG